MGPFQPELCFRQKQGVEDKSLSNADKAKAWMNTRCGRAVLRDLYAIAAGFVPDWQKTGIPVSMDYIFHIERHQIKRVKSRAQKMGIKIEKWENYSLNNNLTPYIADHIMQHRTDWAGLFETRKRHE